MRVDDNRPSASEQAAKDDRNRQNIKQKDPALNSQSGQAAARAQAKEAKSAFDLVLENYTSAHLPTQSEEAKFDSKVKDALADQDKRDRESSDRKKDKKEEKRTGSSEEKDSSSREVSTRDKVISKQGSGGQGGSGGGGSGGEDKGGSSGQFGQRSYRQATPGRADLAAQGIQGASPTESAFSNKLSGSAASTREIPKAVLDQIVQHVRIGLNKDLDKEIHLDLAEKIFKGLSLKVSTKNGKVEVTFLTQNANVRRLFESQKGNIGKTLSEKGIAVSKIQVQYLG
jgi:hypothetical protein